MEKYKILIFDDSQETCLKLDDFLYKQGFNVEGVNTYYEAIEYLKKSKFDVVFCSLTNIPEPIFEKINELKSVCSSTDIVLIISQDMIGFVKDNFKGGISDFILKPFSNEEILFVINRLQKKKVMENKLNFFFYENIELIEEVSLYRSLIRIISNLEIDRLKDQILEEILNYTFGKVAILYILKDANDEYLFYDRHKGDIKFLNFEDKIHKNLIINGEQSFFFSKNQINLPVIGDNNIYCLVRILEPQLKDGFREKEFNKALYFSELLPIAFENALKFESLRRCNVKDYETNVYYWDIFKDFVNKEIFKALRYDRKLSMLGVRIENFDEIKKYHSEKNIKNTILDVVTTINSIIRESDWFVEKKVGDYIIFLTETDYFGALMTIPRIKKALTGKCVIKGAQRVDDIHLNIAAVGLPLHGATLEGLLDNLTVRLNISKNSLVYKIGFHKLSFEEICIELLNLNLKEYGKNEKLYIWDKRRQSLFFENILLLLDELKIHPNRRGVFYAGFFDGRKVVTLLNNRNLQNLQTKIYFFCNENKEEVDYPGIIAVGSEKVSLSDFYFILSLNEHYTYMLLCNGDRFFESSDFLLVEELISKLQSEYHLQWQL